MHNKVIGGIFLLQKRGERRDARKCETKFDQFYPACYSGAPNVCVCVCVCVCVSLLTRGCLPPSQAPLYTPYDPIMRTCHVQGLPFGPEYKKEQDTEFEESRVVPSAHLVEASARLVHSRWHSSYSDLAEVLCVLEFLALTMLHNGAGTIGLGQRH
jgi:hypothetical protein